MKNKKLVGSLVVILMFFGTITNSMALNLNNSPKTSQEELINIDFPIYIDGNWSVYVDLYDWCSGSGTEENPYVIEGIHVTNEQQTAHISIENVEHFIIRNCIVSNYSAPYGHYTFSGIYIGNGTFGLIDNCIIINCTTGISLGNVISFNLTKLPDTITDTIKITNCKFIGSHNASDTGLGCAISITGRNYGYGFGGDEMVITNVKNVNISHNDIYNYYGGIIARLAEGIYIDNNRIETTFGYVVEVGIYFYNVNDSTITNNDFYGCEFGGHDYEAPKTSSDGFSIDLENCNNIEIYGNKFYDLNGNLIGGSSDNALNYWIFIIFGVAIAVVVVSSIIFKKRKSKIE